MKLITETIGSIFFAGLLLLVFFTYPSAPKSDAELSAPLAALAWVLRFFAEIIGAALGSFWDLLQWIANLL
jgi:hypothetical protein